MFWVFWGWDSWERNWRPSYCWTLYTPFSHVCRPAFESPCTFCFKDGFTIRAGPAQYTFCTVLFCTFVYWSRQLVCGGSFITSQNMRTCSLAYLCKVRDPYKFLVFSTFFLYCSILLIIVFSTVTDTEVFLRLCLFCLEKTGIGSGKRNKSKIGCN